MTTATDSATRQVSYNFSPGLPELLGQLGASLLITTYQANKLVVVGSHAGALTVSFHNFERIMGLALAGPRLAIGTRRETWLLLNAPELAPRVGTPGTHDACFLTRACRYTGDIQGHEMAFGPDGVWVVNTLFCCLCTLSEEYSFVPQWKPPFISTLAPEDRCHLNGVAMENGRPRFVTAMAETDTKHGWRPHKAQTGLVMDLTRNTVIARGFAMPHSPRIAHGQLWVLDSGRGTVTQVSPAQGTREEIIRLPGYTRGLDFLDRYAAVGLSRIRETAVFSGIPIAEFRDELRCGVSILDWRGGKEVGRIEFTQGVEEIFAVHFLPGMRNPYISGPSPDLDGQEPVWLVPSPRN